MKSKININAILNHHKNALNRTATKVRRAMIEHLKNEYKIATKNLKAPRIKIQRAKNSNLSVRIYATKKGLTPLMLTKSARIDNSYFGIAKPNRGGKFYVRSKVNSSTYKDYEIKRSKLTPKGRKKAREYFYLGAKTMLDDELLKLNIKLQKEAIKIFTDEIKKG